MILMKMDIIDRPGGAVMELTRAVLRDIRGPDSGLHLPRDGPAGRTPSTWSLPGSKCFFFFLYFASSTGYGISLICIPFGTWIRILVQILGIALTFFLSFIGFTGFDYV